MLKSNSNSNDEQILQEYEQYIAEYGITDTIIDAYCDASEILMSRNRDLGLKCCNRTKEIIEQMVLSITGHDIWQVERDAQAKGIDIDLVKKYYKILKYESFDLFESFLLYMEQERGYTKRFYLPRKQTLKIVVDDLQALEDRKDCRRFYGLSMPSRVGKLIADNTPVLTTNGWKLHGDLVVGDYVYGLDGKPKKVLYVHPKHYANKRVHFSDHTYIDCHENHEWVLFNRVKNRIETVETKNILKTLTTKENDNQRPRWFLPKKEIIQGEYRELSVPPYVLGAWLGDGTNRRPVITISDNEIYEEVIRYGYNCTSANKQVGCTAYLFDKLRKDLQKYGMCIKNNKTEKYIPDEYLISSVEQRLELLAGLLDTDGCLIKKEHRYQFSTISERLKDDVVSLVSTFGWRVCVTKQKATTSSSGIIGRHDVYTVAFNPTLHIPCKVERKKLYEFSKTRRIAVTKIEDISPVSGNCITVEDSIYRVGRRMIPTHNSTICIFFLAWIAMKRPNSHNAMGGHSGILAKSFYKELLNIMTTSEYKFYELYTYFHPKYAKRNFPTDKSADDLTITLGKPDRFATISCRGIDGTWTGAIDVSQDGYLYVDDLVRDREHSLSPIRMDSTYQEYLNKMVDRKNDGARELMVGTLWNVFDPLQRISIDKENDSTYIFRRIPALNENDESNFQYEINGFSTQYYRDMRDRLSLPEWFAKYQQKPYVREGLVFPKNEIMFHDGIIPDGECVVTALCDPSFGGADKLSMPVKLHHIETGTKIIIDWVYKSGTQAITVPLIVDSIIRNVITELRIEKNAGGGLLADSIKAELAARNCRHCKITLFSASSREKKEERIKGYSDFVKQNYHFLIESRYLPTVEEDYANKISRYRRTEMYDSAMEELHMFTSEGKNPHDDAADSITNMAKHDETKDSAVVPVFNPFRA